MDERGFITRKTYDLATGGLIQQIDDVDTSVVSGAPSGWTTPSGGGLNLVTDYQVDNLGPTTQILGPSHVVDLAGTATTIRTATWFVYQDATYQTWTAKGYATGTGPSYTYTLVNPVSINITDAQGRTLEQIQATRGSGVTDSGALSPSDSYPQTSYVRWKTAQYTDCCFVASERVYKLIPSSGSGSSGTNYDEAEFGYDLMKRQYRTVTPGGTITDLVFEPRGIVIGVWVGTDDTGATPTDPSGGASGNNMVQITENEYDNGSDGGDGYLTEVTQFVDASTSRVTTMTYDFRGRLLTTDGEIDFFELLEYDNLDQVVKAERYDTTASGNLIGRTVTNFDDLGRVFQRAQYAVNPSTGAVGNSLIDNNWYDAAGNLMKSFPAGSQLFIKTAYDSLQRPATEYIAFGPDSTYSDAESVANNTVMEQFENTYDEAGNTILNVRRQRYHNAAATQTGSLVDPNTSPMARVTYIASYPDAIGRTIANSNYGTNGGSALSRPATIPTPSDSILVGMSSFDATDKVSFRSDPAGMVKGFGYDAAGRITTITENDGGSSSGGTACTASDDVDRVTDFTYSEDGHLATLVAHNSRTGTQTTTYTYGTTLSDSDVATSNLLRYINYPDSTGGSDRVSRAYNRQAEQISQTDQLGCVHQYLYDLLGRMERYCPKFVLVRGPSPLAAC